MTPRGRSLDAGTQPPNAQSQDGSCQAARRHGRLTTLNVIVNYYPMVMMPARAPSALQLDRVFQALSNRTRRALLAQLDDGPQTVTALASPFRMSLPAISRHIRVLEESGLLTRTIDGRVHSCALNAEPLRDADRWLARYRRFWGETLHSLAAYVKESKARPTGA
jgi:DNA-binding transcriptional ArsR family regulator